MNWILLFAQDLLTIRVCKFCLETSKQWELLGTLIISMADLCLDRWDARDWAEENNSHLASRCMCVWRLSEGLLFLRAGRRRACSHHRRLCQLHIAWFSEWDSLGMVTHTQNGWRAMRPAHPSTLRYQYQLYTPTPRDVSNASKFVCQCLCVWKVLFYVDLESTYGVEQIVSLSNVLYLILKEVKWTVFYRMVDVWDWLCWRQIK